MLWSDESNIELFKPPGAAQYVRRRRGEAYQPDCIAPSVKFGGGSIMAFTRRRRTRAVRMNSQYYTQILEEMLEPILKYRNTTTPTR
ncbi:hypothetical protein Trydic_g12632 [Trypoxylus dichotomus]